jgi:hypothetical protein
MLISLSTHSPSFSILFLCVAILCSLIAAVYVLRNLPKRHITHGAVPWLFRNKGFFGQEIERLFNIDPTSYIEEGYQKVRHAGEC